MSTAAHSAPKEIDWDDLIPWTAVFSPGEVKFNKSLVEMKRKNKFSIREFNKNIYSVEKLINAKILD